ncbi:hypothetical protein JG688_00018241 [Phytophthora aleatoria]|uniref:ATP-dependent DNA helicase n=1 Tax=Phytophthora aleatoria TaxID=2496075 RepID=A0A8J5LUU9_9STRA|nr:hypothetical protein JG688_00018241 [Phytophthora aleatoria]
MRIKNTCTTRPRRLFILMSQMHRFRFYREISFFLDGPGEIISAGNAFCKCSASSGTAAQLLTGGRTAHLTFRLPLDPHETTTCNFGVRS